MKTFRIIDENSHDFLFSGCRNVVARNERSALNKFKKTLLTRGYYWITSDDEGIRLRSSYGSCFRAEEIAPYVVSSELHTTHKDTVKGYV